MNDKLKKLLEALVESGMDFHVSDEQGEIGIWIGDWSLTMNKNGKWSLN